MARNFIQYYEDYYAGEPADPKGYVAYQDIVAFAIEEITNGYGVFATTESEQLLPLASRPFETYDEADEALCEMLADASKKEQTLERQVIAKAILEGLALVIKTGLESNVTVAQLLGFRDECEDEEGDE